MSSGPGKVVGLGRAQKPETVLQNLEHAVAEDRHVVLGELLEDGEHHLLLAQGAGILDPQFLGVGEQFSRRLGFEFLEDSWGLRNSGDTGGQGFRWPSF